ncbi:TetR/AcrR family transcriptional regulator [Streptomyces viridosporus]|uniref:TetR/AcrR family transcriptional regulator n=1 Tax=Streptomyces viridosporus TaxID=67581 RepID=UPI0009BE7304|nr:TetR family transcriptional regulator [Streptomyces viridosporus]
MARPKVPLISRRKALEAALEIVDSEGLDALSIRRLGEALKVNGASLYHHFRNKDEILVGVTQLALADVATPRTENENWRVWLPLNAYRTRQALISHPELIPVMLRRAPLGIGLTEVESSVQRLQAEGVPLPMIAPLMEGLELLAITSALQETGKAGPTEGEDGEVATPSLHAAVEARGMSSEELFQVMASSMISIIESTIQLKETRLAAERLSQA